MDEIIDNFYMINITEACKSGDLLRLHNAYSKWLQDNRPDPITGRLPANWFLLAAGPAVHNNHPACLAYLCQQGLIINACIVSWAVQAALEFKSTTCLQILLDHGWNINMPEGDYKPPFLGRVVDDPDLFHWFIAHGADPSAPAGVWDLTPMSYAVQKGSFDTIKFLVDNGGSLTRGQLLNMAAGRTDPDCVSILQYLFDHGNTAINEIMFETKPELREWSNLGNETPLHNAAWTGNIDAVQWLLRHGADPTIRTKNKEKTGYLPLDYAIRHEKSDIADLLIQATKTLVNTSGIEPILQSSVDWGKYPHARMSYSYSPEEMPTGRDMNKVPKPGVPLPRFFAAINDSDSTGRNCAQANYSMYLMIVEQKKMRDERRARERQEVPNETNVNNYPVKRSQDATIAEAEDHSTSSEGNPRKQQRVESSVDQVSTQGDQDRETPAADSKNYPDRASQPAEIAAPHTVPNEDDLKPLTAVKNVPSPKGQLNEIAAKIDLESHIESEDPTLRIESEETFHMVTKDTALANQSTSVEKPEQDPPEVRQSPKSGFWAALGWK